MNTTTTNAAEIKWTTAGGTAIAIVAGDSSNSIAIKANGKYLGTLFKHSVRDAMIAGDIVTVPGKAKIAVPAEIKPLLVALASEQGNDRQAEYNALEVAWRAAKAKADQARETAYGRDTGAGFDRVRELDAAAEAARLAVVAFGDLHQGSETDGARDN